MKADGSRTSLTIDVLPMMVVDEQRERETEHGVLLGRLCGHHLTSLAPGTLR